MEQINRANEDSILSTESTQLKDYIIKSCVYLQRYYANQSMYVIRRKDTIYIGIIVKKTSDYVILESASKTNLDDELEIIPVNDEHIKVSNYSEIYEPRYTDLDTIHKLVIHNTVDNTVRQIELDGVLKQPLRYRASTEVYPHAVEYHCFIGEKIYTAETETTATVDTVDIDEDSIIDFGYLNEEKQLPLITIDQPTNDVLEDIPLLDYIITFSTYKDGKLTNVVDLNDVIESTMYMVNHPFVDIYDECVGHIHANQDLIMPQYISAYQDAFLHFGDNLVISQNFVKWSTDVLDEIRDIQSENDQDEQDDSDTDEQEDRKEETYGFIIFGEETNNKRKIKHPFISAGVYSIPLSKILPEKLNSYSYSELLDIVFNDASDIDIPNEWEFIINLLSNYDRETDTYWLNPISRLHKMENTDSRNIGYNQIYNVDMVIDAIQSSANKDTMFENDEVDFISDYNEGNRTLLAQRADIYPYQNTASIIVPYTDAMKDGQWVAKKEIFSEYGVDIPTTLTIQKGESCIEYTDIVIESVVDVDENISTPVEVLPKEIYEIQQREDVDNKYEPLVFGDDTDIQQDEDAKLVDKRNMSNTEFATMISNGSILPPINSNQTFNYPKPL